MGGGEWFSHKHTHVNINTENTFRVRSLDVCKRREMAASLTGVAVVRVLLDFMLLKVPKSDKLPIPK